MWFLKAASSSSSLAPNGVTMAQITPSSLQGIGDSYSTAMSTPQLSGGWPVDAQSFRFNDNPMLAISEPNRYLLVSHIFKYQLRIPFERIAPASATGQLAAVHIARLQPGHE